MQDPFIGEIMTFAGAYVPYSGSQFAPCNGQLMPISENQALYSVLGTAWGGDGRTSFGLPDLRGRAIVGPGTGPGLTSRIVGNSSGTETVTLTQANLATHSHAFTLQNVSASSTISKSSISISATSVVNCDSGGASEPDPSGAYPGNDSTNPQWSSAAGETMNAGMVQTTAEVTQDIPLSLDVSVPQQITNNAGSSTPLSVMQPWACVTYAIAINGLYPPRS